MRHMIINLYLLAGAWYDGKTKKIRSSYLWVGIFLGMILKIVDSFSGNFYFYEWILSVTPGMFFLAAAGVGRKNIGDGDGWVLLILAGCYLKKQIWKVFYLSVTLLAIYSFLLLILGKANKKTEIPYLPFVWISDTILWGLEYVS